MLQVKFVHATPKGDELISRMARVSNPSNEDNYETAPKLISYLINHKHWSPFEMATMCVEIHTTRSIASQLLRHKSMFFQEFSQRYANTAQLGEPIVPHLRGQDKKNRQNSIDDLDTRIGATKLSGYYRRISALFDDAVHLYQEMVSDGVAKECAREVLPLATPTRLYMHGTVRSWIHYCDLRMANGTQYEHQIIAKSCFKHLKDAFPMVAAAYELSLRSRD
tara:strand:- start:918 stop:1583 length:666 start_codon:yes stop_codon:yes gene_type:complete